MKSPVGITLEWLWHRSCDLWRTFRKPARRDRLGMGSRGENLAAEWLQDRGMEILSRNLKLAGCELDLVAREGKTLVFVEVKTRRHHDRGRPEEAVGPRKQRQISRAAAAYLKKNRIVATPCRFDVVAVTLSGTNPPEIRHFPHAFEAPS